MTAAFSGKQFENVAFRQKSLPTHVLDDVVLSPATETKFLGVMIFKHPNAIAIYF